MLESAKNAHVKICTNAQQLATMRKNTPPVAKNLTQLHKSPGRGLSLNYEALNIQPRHPTPS